MLEANIMLALTKNSFATSFLDDEKKQLRIDGVELYVEPFSSDAD
ncbi:MAG: hypothetical protein OSB67_10230 [Alphaproteobacteria bacterium]|nr:hypothetical protein [Alphaproteobacteria bacterium]